MLIGIVLIVSAVRLAGLRSVLFAGRDRRGITKGATRDRAAAVRRRRREVRAVPAARVAARRDGEGPTPVSALIHAATMVTAGVYLVVRMHVIFEISGVALTVVAIVGLVTVLFAGTCALGQDDIKRVLAYSTISQLGFMFIAAGLRAYSAAMFLLVAHAFFKALLFLGAGSVMHGTGRRDRHEEDGRAPPFDAGDRRAVLGRCARARRHPAARGLLREGPHRGLRDPDGANKRLGAGARRRAVLGALHRPARLPHVLRTAAERGRRARGESPA